MGPELGYESPERRWGQGLRLHHRLLLTWWAAVLASRPHLTIEDRAACELLAHRKTLIGRCGAQVIDERLEQVCEEARWWQARSGVRVQECAWPGQAVGLQGVVQVPAVKILAQHIKWRSGLAEDIPPGLLAV